MRAIDRAVAHYKKRKNIEISVPEWGDEKGPLIIYMTPLSISDMNAIRAMSKKNDAESVFAVNLIVMKATDKQGERLFSVNDRESLITQCDQSVIERISERLQKFFFEPAVAQKGN